MRERRKYFINVRLGRIYEEKSSLNLYQFPLMEVYQFWTCVFFLHAVNNQIVGLKLMLENESIQKENNTKFSKLLIDFGD